MYLLDNERIEVTGSHIVYYNNEWINVENIKGLTKKKIYVDTLYCLITENNTIKLKNYIFRDYQETSDIFTLSLINDMIKSNMNNNYKTNPNTLEHIYQPCISLETYNEITDKEGYIKILNTEHIKMYNYKGYILSGNVLVYDNEIWNRVWECNESIITDYNEPYLYHTIVKNHIIKLNNIIIRDYLETDFNVGINNIVLNNLN